MTFSSTLLHFTFSGFQESAVDFQEIEEALMIVKQRKAKDDQELDFLLKVDNEKVRGQFLCFVLHHQGLYSLSGKTSYRKISWSLEAARFGSKLFQSLWNWAGTSAALLLRCLSNFRAIRPLQHPISRLRDFTRFGGKTSYRLVNRGPVLLQQDHILLSCFIASGNDLSLVQH